MSLVSAERNQEFKELKHVYQKEIKKAKSDSRRKFCKEEFDLDPFKAIKKVNGKIQQPPISSLRTSNGVISSEMEILKTL